VWADAPNWAGSRKGGTGLLTSFSGGGLSSACCSRSTGNEPFAGLFQSNVPSCLFVCLEEMQFQGGNNLDWYFGSIWLFSRNSFRAC
jgi:hypothetical protein